MLLIREEQMEALRRAPLRRFVHEVIVYLRTVHPSLVAGRSEDNLLIRVEAKVQRGRDQGITRKESLKRYVVLSLRYGMYFDEHPLIRRVIEDARIPPNERFDALALLVPAFVWEEIYESVQTPGVWFDH